MLEKIGHDFHKNLIDLLIQKRAYKVAQVVYDEYNKTMYVDPANDILGLKLASVQGDLDQFGSLLKNLVEGIRSDETINVPESEK